MRSGDQASSVESLLLAELCECLEDAAASARTHNLFVIGITSRRDLVSKIVLRAGRFHLQVHSQFAFCIHPPPPLHLAPHILCKFILWHPHCLRM